MAVTKTVFTVSTLAFLALFGGGVYLFMNLGSIAKGLIEREASAALGVAVRMADLDIRLTEKTAQVRGLTIANPKGYKEPYAVRIGDITVALGDISTTLIQFKKISVSDVQTALEVNDEGTNLNALKAGMRAKPKAAEKEGAAQKSDDQKSEPPKVIIDKFALTGASVKPHAVLFSQDTGDLDPVNLPDIHLSNIGAKERGVTIREAIVQVSEPFMNAAINTAAREGLLQGLSDNILGEMGVQSLIPLNAVPGAGAIGDAVNQGLKGLFGE